MPSSCCETTGRGLFDTNKSEGATVKRIRGCLGCLGAKARRAPHLTTSNGARVRCVPTTPGARMQTPAPPAKTVQSGRVFITKQPHSDSRPLLQHHQTTISLNTFNTYSVRITPTPKISITPDREDTPISADSLIPVCPTNDKDRPGPDAETRFRYAAPPRIHCPSRMETRISMKSRPKRGPDKIKLGAKPR